ncbi:hypothetical protein BASA81_002596 [Batrachochytrium salamandrivorans]|nr:hypothetical protein BASA81_002596 [Batrachochytrium salamandrivorans]
MANLHARFESITQVQKMDNEDEELNALFPLQHQAIQLAELLGTTAEGEERHLEKLEWLLKPYQELPQALDACLPQLCNWLMKRVHTSPSCCRGLYLLCKIRGRKFVARQLPKQVEFLDESLMLLQSDKPWESKYVGLVWLSLLVMLPFELGSLTDTSVSELEQVLTGFVLENKPTRDPASLCLAKLLTRRDCESEMQQFLSRDTAEVGLLLTKAAVFKRTSNWDQVASHALLLFPPILAQCQLHFASSEATVKVVYIKLLQRMFTRQLGDSVCQAFVWFLLNQALGDGDSRVRWQTAKAMRRLVSNGVAEAYPAVLQVFVWEGGEEEDLWHGACLALGEMIRCKQQLAINVTDTIALCVANALGFDKRRGTRNLGSNIRDAGCYVAWALVRTVPKTAFTPQDCVKLANLLLVTSVFDREVSCRRAASAALQEAVGRLGMIPHGIDLLPLVSYQSVGNVNRAYLEVCPAVCQFPEYCAEMVDHLVQVKTRHWDEHIRAVCEPTRNQFELHGGLLALAEVVTGQTDKLGDTLALTLRAIQSSFPVSLTMLPVAWLKLLQSTAEAKECGWLEQESEKEEFMMALERGLGNEATRQAAVLALGSVLRRQSSSSSNDHSRWMSTVYGLHACVLAGVDLPTVLPKLERAVQMRTNSHVDRVEALVALSRCPYEFIDQAFAACLFGLEDKSHSNQHGDVGSWVRRQACLSLRQLYLNKPDVPRLSAAVRGCALFSCDRLDHVREAGARALFTLTNSGDQEDEYFTLEQSFQRVLDLFLLNPKVLLAIKTNILRCLVVTLGSLNESPSQAAQDVLERWYLAPTTSLVQIATVYDSALELLRSAREDETQTIAVCKAIVYLLLNLSHHRPQAAPPTIWRESVVQVLLLTTAQQQPRRKASISKQASVAHVLIALSKWEEVAALLVCPFPALRRQVAEFYYVYASGLPDPLPLRAMEVCLQIWQTGGDTSSGNEDSAKTQFLLGIC